jgi:hypothetical protein
MYRAALLSAALAGSALAFGALAGDDLKSTFKPGDSVGVFSPYNVTGKAAGKPACQV